VVDYDTGQVMYSGPDEEPKAEELAELENQLDRIEVHADDDVDKGMNLKKHADEKAALESSHMAERTAAAKALNAQVSALPAFFFSPRVCRFLPSLPVPLALPSSYLWKCEEPSMPKR